jgi:hypothetical protein
MRIGITGAKTNIGMELVKMGAVSGVWETDDIHIFCESPSNKIPYIAQFFHISQMFCKPIILVSSYEVFRGKRLFWKWGYKEKEHQNPDTDDGFLLLGVEAIALTTDNIKIVRIGWDGKFDCLAKGIFKFAERFDEMPKILHLSSDDSEARCNNGRRTILNNHLAKKLGIL